MEEVKFNGKKAEAIKLLASGLVGKSDISKILEISRTTLWEWEKDPEFKTAVDKFGHDLEKFGELLIKSKTMKAIDGYWNLTESSANDMVRKSGYEFFIERSLGKLSNTIKVSNDTDSQQTIKPDILEQEQIKFQQRMIEEADKDK